MKQIFTIVLLLMSLTTHAQQKLFRVYTDSASLIKDANAIVDDFVAKVNAVKPVFTSKPTAILNTQPYLIFYSPRANQISLPIWHQVMQQQKTFFVELAGSEQEGEKVFGLLFNGLYLPHELGHALQNAAIQTDTARFRSKNLYESEYFANTVAVLYWKNSKRNQELEECYRYAKKMLGQLKNPVPPGQDPVTYFQDHYQEMASNPYQYGYFQFKQLVEIFEDKELKNFNEFLKDYLSR